MVGRSCYLCGVEPILFQLRVSEDRAHLGLGPLHRKQLSPDWYLGGKLAEGRAQRISDNPSRSPSVQTMFIKCKWAVGLNPKTGKLHAVHTYF